jgi:hypothetical protein
MNVRGRIASFRKRPLDGLWTSLWRTKTSQFQTSVEMGRKNVDKNIDKHNKQ